MIAGGALAIASAVLAGLDHLGDGRSAAIALSGLTAAAIAVRVQRLSGAARLVWFYAAAALVLGLTTAGQGYLRIGIGGLDTHGTAVAWLVVAAGLTMVAGAGATLVRD
jgi:hypothetical protein